MRACSIDGCTKVHLARGLCGKHYQRLRAQTAPTPPRKPPCSIVDCSKPEHGRGWCKMHHKRWLKTGDPLGVLGPKGERLTPEEVVQRFWARVDKTGDCWLWTGPTVDKGYGWSNKQRAHRHSWTIAHGPIPAGLHVLHRCDNPPCVRPSHLFLGTNLDNVIDKVQKGRVPSVLTAEQIPAIRLRLIAGEQRSAVARDYGVSRTTIADIDLGRSWAWVA